MENPPLSSDPRSYCSSNLSDSSEDSGKRASAKLVIPDVGYNGQQEVDSCRLVSPVGEEGITSDSERTVSFGAIPSGGYRDVLEADSGHCKSGGQGTRSDAEFLQKNENHTTLKTDRAISVDPDHRNDVKMLQGKRGLLKILPVNNMEVKGIGHGNMLSKNTKTDRETGDVRILLTDAKKHENGTPLMINRGKSVYPGHHGVVRLQGKRGLLKMLPSNNTVVRCTADGNILLKDSNIDEETSDGNILLKDSNMDWETVDGKLPLTDTKMVPLTLDQNRKEQLSIPKWLKDYYKSNKINVDADIDGWQHEQILRAHDRRKDKFYKHRDYVDTFRSKKEVKEFLDTGKVKGKVIRKKSVDPSGQSSGPRRSTKRRMAPLMVNTAKKAPQGFGWSGRGETPTVSSKVPHGFL